MSTFNIRPKYKPGLTPECKQLMAERDAARKNVKKTSITERKAQMLKYGPSKNQGSKYNWYGEKSHKIIL